MPWSDQIFFPVPEARVAFEMTGSKKRKTLLLIGLVMVITGIIAASLPQMEMQPGMPIPRLVNSQMVIVPVESEPVLAMPIDKFFVILLGLLLAGTILYAIIKVLKGADWKTIAAFIRSMVIISLLISGLLFLILLMPRGEVPEGMVLPLPTPVPPVTSPLGPVPPLLLWIVGIGLLVLSLIVGVWIFTSSRKPKTIELVGFEAEKAWQALKTGLDLKDVIIQCYRQMSLALEKDQGIERRNYMTTGEFEKLLEETGMPHGPIHQLTRLFDAVRYGNWQPNPADEQQAIKCLEDIMDFSHAVAENKSK